MANILLSLTNLFLQRRKKNVLNAPVFRTGQTPQPRGSPHISNVRTNLLTCLFAYSDSFSLE